MNLKSMVKFVKPGIISLTIVAAGVANAVPVEYDLAFTASSGVSFDIGFILDTDLQSVVRNEADITTFTYTDSSTNDFVYHTITRVGSEVYTVENWFTPSDGDDYTIDMFYGQYNYLSNSLALISTQDPANSSDPTGAGFEIYFYDVKDIHASNWYDQASGLSLIDRSDPNADRYFSIATSDSKGFELGLATAGLAPVPEPATMILFGIGLACLVGARARNKKN